MKLATFSLPTDSAPRLGLVLASKEGKSGDDLIADIVPLQQLLFNDQQRKHILPANLDMVGFLSMGAAAQQSLAQLQSTLEADDRRVVHEQGEFVHKVSLVKLYAPIAQPSKIICIGLNYRDHCAEQNKPIPTSPIIFAKYANTIIGPSDPIIIPPITEAVDYETELAVVIGKAGKGITKADALNYVGGYMIMNDVTARDFQRADGQFVRAKTQDTFAPCGPYLVTADTITNPQSLDIDCWVNGELRQHSNTAQMVFDVAALISYISAGISLAVGDIISTGTPGGVGEHMQPPRFLKAGDKVTMQIAELGILENPVQ